MSAEVSGSVASLDAVEKALRASSNCPVSSVTSSQESPDLDQVGLVNIPEMRSSIDSTLILDDCLAVGIGQPRLVRSEPRILPRLVIASRLRIVTRQELSHCARVISRQLLDHLSRRERAEFGAGDTEARNRPRCAQPRDEISTETPRRARGTPPDHSSLRHRRKHPRGRETR